MRSRRIILRTRWERTAFQYCTALNHLLAEGEGRRVQIGDATTVFWTEQPTEAENLLPWVFEPSKAAEDEALKAKLNPLLERIAAEKYPSELGERTTPFYVLGLSPNAARVSIRFWWVSTLGQVVENLHQHFADLAMVRSDRDPEYIDAWRLLRETVRDAKEIPPLLGGALLRAILTGGRYPSMLFTSLIPRIRADREVRYVRGAAIKACRLNTHIFESLRYASRDTHGVQLPHETLALGNGSCRDFAVLMMEAARHWGFGARFVTGYIQMEAGQHGATHAWTEIYLPGAGWRGFDPTNNKLAGGGHTSVAVTRSQEKAAPLSGSWPGPGDAFEFMKVSVQVVAL